MIIIDYKDTRPIYEQIVARFEHLILCGVLSKDARIPSVRSLAMELSLNPNTVSRAYNELERRGFIYQVPGKGSFVSMNDEILEGRKKELRERLLGVLKEAEELGIEARELLDGITKIETQRYTHD